MFLVAGVVRRQAGDRGGGGGVRGPGSAGRVAGIGVCAAARAGCGRDRFEASIAGISPRAAPADGRPGRRRRRDRARSCWAWEAGSSYDAYPWGI